VIRLAVVLFYYLVVIEDKKPIKGLFFLFFIFYKNLKHYSGGKIYNAGNGVL
jgi:hypothetical protein